MSRYVYRRDDDVPARPNANHNVVTIGAMPAPTQIYPIFSRSAVVSPGGSQVEMCPSWGCGGPPRFIPVFQASPGPGATATTPQPPPGQMPGYTVQSPYAVPATPAPAPTVAVPPSQTAPSLTTPGTTLSTTGSSTGAWLPNTAYAVGQAVVDAAGHTQQVLVAGTSGPSAPNFNDVGGNTTDGSVVWNDTGVGGSATAGIGAWLAQSTLISGIPNWTIAGGGVLLLMMFAMKKR